MVHQDPQKQGPPKAPQQQGPPPSNKDSAVAQLIPILGEELRIAKLRTQLLEEQDKQALVGDSMASRTLELQQQRTGIQEMQNLKDMSESRGHFERVMQNSQLPEDQQIPDPNAPPSILSDFNTLNRAQEFGAARTLANDTFLEAANEPRGTILSDILGIALNPIGGIFGSPDLAVDLLGRDPTAGELHDFALQRLANDAAIRTPQSQISSNLITSALPQGRQLSESLALLQERSGRNVGAGQIAGLAGEQAVATAARSDILELANIGVAEQRNEIAALQAFGGQTPSVNTTRQIALLRESLLLSTGDGGTQIPSTMVKAFTSGLSFQADPSTGRSPEEDAITIASLDSEREGTNLDLQIGNVKEALKAQRTKIENPPVQLATTDAARKAIEQETLAQIEIMGGLQRVLKVLEARQVISTSLEKESTEAAAAQEKVNSKLFIEAMELANGNLGGRGFTALDGRYNSATRAARNLTEQSLRTVIEIMKVLRKTEPDATKVRIAEVFITVVAQQVAGEARR